eukprot:scaffold277908_cov15-Tisochrysis_lutea.AAC.1
MQGRRQADPGLLEMTIALHSMPSCWGKKGPFEQVPYAPKICTHKAWCCQGSWHMLDSQLFTWQIDVLERRRELEGSGGQSSSCQDFTASFLPWNGCQPVPASSGLTGHAMLLINKLTQRGKKTMSNLQIQQPN